jgi:putative ABC transport system permease protein
VTAAWRPALRMARRDLARHKIRTALIAALVALPVLVGVAAAQVVHNSRWEGEHEARATMGAADAIVDVTPFARTRVVYWAGAMSPRPASFSTDDAGHRRPLRRSRADVNLLTLLPSGSTITPAPAYGDVALSSGGTGHVEFLDLSSAMVDGLASLDSGRPPVAGDEVAMNGAAADELGLLTADKTLRRDATVSILNGTVLRVVGVLADDNAAGSNDGVNMVAPPVSELRGDHHPYRYLVDLPGATGPAPHALVRLLAAVGVAMMPRDVAFHPQAWHVQVPAPSRLDPVSVAVGALAVLFGLVEVVLIVGSAFAVGARRQVHDLGLLAACGGAPVDVRRVVLAQGLVLGVGASLLGAVAGVGAFLGGVPLFEHVAHQTVWSREVDWLAVVAVTLLGSLTGVAAAVVPAWRVGRLTPLAALSGRFPVRAGESRAHRPALVLAGVGLAVLLCSGVWTAREYTRPAVPGARAGFAGRPSPLPVALGSLGLLLLIGGVVWSAPYAVRLLAAVGQLLPLSARFAFRDAARHRFRTAAAAVAVTVTCAGAVFTGFVMQSVTATHQTRSPLPAHSIMLNVGDSGTERAIRKRANRMLGTIRHVVGPISVLDASRVSRPHRPLDALAVTGPGGVVTDVMAVSDTTLRYLIGPGNRAAVHIFHAGGVVTTTGLRARTGRLRLAVYPDVGKPSIRFTAPAAVVPSMAQRGQGQLSTAWISLNTTRHLGLVTIPDSILAIAQRPITAADLTRLSVHGIDTWSPDTDLAQIHRLRVGVLAVAGALTALVIAITVALAAAEGRADQATMAAVGAGPWQRRSLGAMHGLFLGLLGTTLGLLIALPSGASLMQIDGLPGTPTPWRTILTVLLALPLLACSAGWLTTPSRVPLNRRAN